MSQELLSKAGSDPVNLPVEQRAKLAIKAQGALTLEELHLEMAGYADIIILPVTDKESDQTVHDAYMTVKALRVDVQGKGKMAREDAVALQKAVVSAEKELIAVIEPVESKLKENRDTYRSAQKALREKAKARAGEIKEAIEWYANYPSKFFNSDSDALEKALHHLEGHDDDHISKFFSQWNTDKVQGQGVEAAIEQRDLALTTLHLAHEKTVASEKAQAELEAVRVMRDISGKVTAGMIGGLSQVDSAINEVAEFGSRNDIDVSDSLSMLGQRKADLEKFAKKVAEQEAQARKVSEAEQAQLRAEKEKAEAEAKAAQQESERLRQAEQKRIAEEAEQVRLNKEAVEKAEADAAEVERLKALQPDKEKLTIFLDQLEAFAVSNAPDLEDDNANVLKDYVLKQVSSMSTAVKTKAESL